MKVFKLLILMALPAAVFGQVENGGFVNLGRGVSTAFAQDYQALGINPSNLGWTHQFSEKRIHLGSAELSASLYSEFFSRSELQSNFSEFSLMNSSRAEKSELAQSFATTPLAFNLNSMIFGGAITNEKLGGIALKVNNKTTYNSQIGETLADLVFLGNTSFLWETLVLEDGTEITNSEDLTPETLAMVVSAYNSPENALSLRSVLDGTKLSFVNTTEFQLGYGRNVINTNGVDIHLGVSGKYILGHNYLSIDATGTNLEVLGAFSPALNLSFEGVTELNATALGVEAKKYAPVGKGFGLDIGTTVIIGSKLKLSAAVNDLGRMTWKSNLYTFNDASLEGIELNSLSDGKVIPQIQELVLGGSSIVDWQSAEEQTTELASQFRLGGALSVTKSFNVGAEIISPLNTNTLNIESSVVSLGMDIRLFKKLILNGGIVFDENNNSNIPLGLILDTGSYQCGIASADLFTYFKEDQPNLSVAFGFLRARI